MKIKGIIYCIHFKMNFGQPEHFIGFTQRTNLMQRLAEHRYRPATSELQALFRRSSEQVIECVKRSATEVEERTISRLMVHCEPYEICPVCARLKFSIEKKTGQPSAG